MTIDEILQEGDDSSGPNCQPPRACIRNGVKAPMCAVLSSLQFPLFFRVVLRKFNFVNLCWIMLEKVRRAFVFPVISPRDMSQ